MKKYRHPLVQTVFTAFFAAMLLLGANNAFALGQVTLTVKNPDPFKGNHSWFIYENEAGDVIEDVATLKNFSDEPAYVTIYAADATSSETGGFILKFREEEQKGIGYWTDVKVRSVTINPSEIVDVPFTIVLPDNVSPGQYLGGLIVESGKPLELDEKAQEDCEKNNLCGASIAVKTRIGSRIYLTVPGKTYEDYSLTDFTASKSITGTTKFEFRIENNGNVAYEPKAVIDVYDGMGNLYEHIEKGLGTSSPGTVIHPIVKMKNRPLIGSFTAKTTVAFNRKFGESQFHAAAESQTMEVKFWVMPWEVLFIAVLLILAASGIFMQRKAAWKKYLANAEEYTVQPHEDIELIAGARHINWKRLARFNKLKPPYTLRQGDKLMVPKKK